MYTCEIRITLTDKREYLCVFSDGDAVCPIDVRRAKSAFKKQLAEVKNGLQLIDFIAALCEDGVDELNTFSDFELLYRDLSNIQDISTLKRIDIETTDGDECCAFRGRLGYDFVTSKGSKSYKEIDPDDLY